MSRRVRITANGDVTGTRVVDAETGEPIRATRVEFAHGMNEIPRATVVSLDVEAELECQAEIVNRLERYVVRDGERPFLCAVIADGVLSEPARSSLMKACEQLSERCDVPFIVLDGGLRVSVLTRPKD